MSYNNKKSKWVQQPTRINPAIEAMKVDYDVAFRAQQLAINAIAETRSSVRGLRAMHPPEPWATRLLHEYDRATANLSRAGDKRAAVDTKFRTNWHTVKSSTYNAEKRGVGVDETVALAKSMFPGAWATEPPTPEEEAAAESWAAGCPARTDARADTASAPIVAAVLNERPRPAVELQRHASGRLRSHEEYPRMDDCILPGDGAPPHARENVLDRVVPVAWDDEDVTIDVLPLPPAPDLTNVRRGALVAPPTLVGDKPYVPTPPPKKAMAPAPQAAQQHVVFDLPRSHEDVRAEGVRLKTFALDDIEIELQTFTRNAAEMNQMFLADSLSKDRFHTRLMGMLTRMDTLEIGIQECRGAEPARIGVTTAFWKKTYAALRAFLDALLLDRPVFTNLATWEALCPDEFGIPIAMPDPQLQKELLGGISLSFPFNEVKPDYEVEASHTQLNSSRIVGSTLMYMNAAKHARRQGADHPNACMPPVVFDIGAGYFGAKKLSMLKTHRQNVGIAIHATIPQYNTADLDRIENGISDPSYTTWNYLPETKVVRLNCLNYCRHLARDCDCLKYYNPYGRNVLAIHSTYEMEMRDFDKVFDYTSCIMSLQHPTPIGQTTPLDKPEYEFLDAEKDENLGLVERFSYKAKRWLTGGKTVTMAPLTVGGTRYTQPYITDTIARGGFHVTDAVLQLEGYTRGDAKTAAAATIAVGAAVLPAVLGVAGTSAAYVYATAVHAALQAALITWGIIRLQYARTRMSTPCYVNYTVRTNVTSAHAMVGKETMSYVCSYKANKPGKVSGVLAPVVVDSKKVDEKQLGRVCASITMAHKREEGKRHMAAALFRDNLPVKSIKDTLEHAIRLCEYVIPNDLCPPPGGQPYSRVTALAASVWGAGATAFLTQNAGYLPFIIPPVASACLGVGMLLSTPPLLVGILATISGLM